MISLPGGGHWALLVGQGDPGNDGYRSFIIDPWQAEPGQAAPTYSTFAEWTTAYRAFCDKEHNIVFPAMNAEATALEQRSLLHQRVGGRIDAGFLQRWSVENGIPGGIQAGGRRATFEASQDFLVHHYFLGESPKLAGEAMNPIFFRSLRDRVAYIIDQEQIGNNSLSAAAVRECSSFNELRPHLERFYRLHDSHTLMEQVASQIENGEMNGPSRTLDAQQHLDRLANALRHMPGMQGVQMGQEEMLSRIRYANERAQEASNGVRRTASAEEILRLFQPAAPGRSAAASLRSAGVTTASLALASDPAALQAALDHGYSRGPDDPNAQPNHGLSIGGLNTPIRSL